MHKSWFLKLSLSGFLLGVSIASFLPVSNTFLLYLLFTVVFLAFLKKWYKFSQKLSVLVFCVLLGQLWFISSFTNNPFKNFDQNKIQLQGEVVSIVPQKNSKVAVIKPYSYSKYISVYAPSTSEFKVGDMVFVYGKVKTYKNTNKDLSKISKNIYAELTPTAFFVTETKKRNLFESNLDVFRKSLSLKIDTLYKNPDHSSFLKGVLFGESSGLTAVTEESFKNLGLTHVLAVSGYNFTLIVLFIYTFLKKQSRALRVSLVLFVSVLFLGMVGESTSVIRAFIMACFGGLSVLFGRRYQPSVSFIFALFIIVFLKPLSLRYDISLQLSALATVAVIYLSPYINTLLSFVFGKSISTKLSSFIDLLSTGISAVIGTLPVTLLNWGTVSVSGPFSGLLVLPALPFIMLLAFLSLFPGLDFLIPPILTSILNSMFSVLNFLSKSLLTQVSINLTNEQKIYVALMILFTLTFLLLKKSKQEWKLTNYPENATLLNGNLEQ